MARDDNGDLKKNVKYPSSVTTAIPREKLPKDLQALVDKQDDWMDDLYEGQGPDTTETNVRYAAYASRVRTIMISASRYVAYTSDVGESFRPVAHPYVVKGAYAVSWAYLVGDVSHEGYKAYCRNQRLLHPENPKYQDATTSTRTDHKTVPMPATGAVPENVPVHIPAIEDYRAVMAQRAVFQSIASMGLPAFTIHSIVRYSGRAMKNVSNAKLRTWGPIGLGLAAVPALPFMFDKPVEEAVEWLFYNGFKMIGGENAVGQRHATGRVEELQKEAVAAKKVKEKEL